MGRAVFPPCCLPWDQTMAEVMRIMATSSRRSQACTAAFRAPDPAAGHRQPTPLLETPGHSWANLGQSLVQTLLLSPGSWCMQGFVYTLQGSVSPVLCKFWWLYGGDNGNLLQEGLCHPQAHLILCRPLLLLPSIFPSMRVFLNESVLHIRLPKILILI